jgi:hypothetical protein
MATKTQKAKAIEASTGPLADDVTVIKVTDELRQQGCESVAALIEMGDPEDIANAIDRLVEMGKDAQAQELRIVLKTFNDAVFRE